MHWKATTFLICTYGVVKEFRPATPFLTPFLVSHYKNLTLEEVYGQIYPFWTYSYLFALVSFHILALKLVVLKASKYCTLLHKKLNIIHQESDYQHAIQFVTIRHCDYFSEVSQRSIFFALKIIFYSATFPFSCKRRKSLECR